MAFSTTTMVLQTGTKTSPTTTTLPRTLSTASKTETEGVISTRVPPTTTTVPQTVLFTNTTLPQLLTTDAKTETESPSLTTNNTTTLSMTTITTTKGVPPTSMVFTSTTPETTVKVPTNTAGTTSHIEAPTETVLTTLTTNMPYKTTTSTKTVLTTTAIPVTSVTSKNLPITSSVTGKSLPLTTTYMTGITTNIATSLSPITDYLPTENSTLTTPSLPLTNTIGSAEVITNLLFNSTLLVPSEAMVLNAITKLKNSRESQLQKSVKVENITYKPISDTSYVLILTLTVSNISIPEDADLRNRTFEHVQDMINDALNTLLNEPTSPVLQPKTSDFTSLSDQINGSINYTFQEGDAIKPDSYLNLLKLLMGSTTTTLSPLTSMFPVTSLNEISGTAEVTSRLVFNTSPVPSKDLVLKAINDLRNKSESNISVSVKLTGVTYENISETSYAVIFTFTLTNISMPEDPMLRNSTSKQVQNMINDVLNTLLNEPTSPVLQPKTSDFTSLSDHINGNINYTFQEGDAIKPDSYLNLLKLLMGSTTTTLSPLTSMFPVTSLNEISGTAEVTSRLVFNTSPVPSKDLVLKAINDLRNKSESNISVSVKLTGVTYENISETSYAVIFTFTLTNISMPEDPMLRNSTSKQVQNTINDVLNTLLNEPTSPVLQPKTSDFTSLSDQINGNINYTFQEGDAIKPDSYLNLLKLLMGSTTTTLSPLTSMFPVTSLNEISGTAEVTSRLVFNTSPVPSKDLVLKAINDLRNKSESNISVSVKLTGVTYENISETSYAVIFTFTLTNISMPEDPMLRNSTSKQVQNTINDVLNTLLNEPTSPVLQPKTSDFTSLSDHINGNINYTFQEGDAIKPDSYLNLLKLLMGSTTTTLSPLTSMFPVTSLNEISGTAEVTSRLVFNTSPVPSKDLVLKAINDLRNKSESNISVSVKLTGVTYENISETSYAVIFTFTLSNISMPKDLVLRNSTSKQVQNTINDVLNTLLNEPNSKKFEPTYSNFTRESDKINGNVDYTFQNSNEIQPVSFLNEIRTLMGVTTTKVPPPASVFPVTSVPETSGLAEVTSTLVFDSSPVPSEDLVLSAVNSLRNSRESKLDKSVKLKNVTYNKISDTSYAVIFKFSVTNVSMSDPVKEVVNITNTALNTLLNEPEIPFDVPVTNFTKNGKQIEVHMDRVFNDAYKIQPVSFLKELESQKLSQNKLIKGKAVIRIRILVETLGPIPSEKAIQEVISSLDSRFTTNQKGRSEKLGEPVSFQNVTFKKISDNSYALDFGFEINNVSMAENKGNRKSTYTFIQDAINKLLNEILHENPSADKINFDDANFTNDIAEVTADVFYNVSKSNIKAPSKFLLKLFKDTTPNRLGTVIIVIKLEFNTRGPVPTESAVLKIANSLLDSRLRTKREVTKLNVPVSSVDVTYTKLSNNSYAINFGFEISDVNMSEKIVLRESTHILVQDSINELLNQILNDPNATPFVFDRAAFTGNTSVIIANVKYVFSENDFKLSSPFLTELLNVNNGLTTTTVPPQASRFPVTSVPEIKGKAVIRIRILVETLGPIPSEQAILEVISSLDSRFTTNQKGRSEKLGEPVSFQNVAFKKISDNSYALDFGFEINNVSMAENKGNRNSTYKFIQDAINKLLNEILHENPSADKINFDDANFTNDIAEVTADVFYNVSKSNIKAPSKFLLKLFEGTTPSRLGKVIIVIKLEFNTRGPVPTESAVLKIANSLLDSRLRTKRQVTKLNDPVSNVNVTYTKLSNNSYALNFGFEIINVNMSERLVLRNSTYDLIQDSINKLLNQILNDPNAKPFVFDRAAFTGNNSVIMANVKYVFKEDDFKFPSPFISELTYVNTGTTTAAPTTTFFPSSTSPTWIVAIIVPCAIAIMLIPCWILLCCLLCGCCARLRQRWHRRRSYNVQYTTRNSIF